MRLYYIFIFCGYTCNVQLGTCMCMINVACAMYISIVYYDKFGMQLNSTVLGVYISAGLEKEFIHPQNIYFSLSL